MRIENSVKHQDGTFPVNIYLFQTKNDVVLMFLLLTLNIFHTFSTVILVDIEQVNVSWILRKQC